MKWKIPDTWRNSPVLWPYRFTECSKTFLSVEPFSCTRSKVPPKGKTEIRSSMVMEPAEDTPTRFNAVFLWLNRKFPAVFLKWCSGWIGAPFLLCSSMDVRMPPPLKMEALTWFHCSSSKNLMLLLTWQMETKGRFPQCTWISRFARFVTRVSSKLIARKMGSFTAPTIRRISLVWLLNSC